MASSDVASESVELDQGGQENPTLKLSVKIDSPASCERHVVVTIPREEIERYFRKGYDNLVPRAEVPGFRAGKAPRRLVERKFREDVSEQVKSSLLMESLQQVTESGQFSAISEPIFDIDAIQLPESGDFTYEFKIEVRPEFNTPNWKGLKLERPVHEFTSTDVESHLARTLASFTSGTAVDEPAKLGDSLLVNLTIEADGATLNQFEEITVQVRPRLSFPDGEIADFDKFMVGVREGETKTATLKLSDSIEDEKYRGKEVTVSIFVKEVSRISTEEMGGSLLATLGFTDNSELHSFVKSELERQFSYVQQQKLREQITAQLTKEANFELPSDLVRRQTARELQRQALELRRSGFSDEQIREVQNASRRNAQAMTVQALREHFILEKIAESEKIEPSSEDYEKEIELIAEQSEISPRRVRAKLERSGQMDALRNQIIERRVIELITGSADVTDKDSPNLLSSAPTSFAIEDPIVPVTAAIPEAKYDNELESKGAGTSVPKLQ